MSVGMVRDLTVGTVQEGWRAVNGKVKSGCKVPPTVAICRCLTLHPLAICWCMSGDVSGIGNRDRGVGGAEERSSAPLSHQQSPRDNYRENYLHSEGWRKLRTFRLNLDKHTCQACGLPSAHLDVHHIIYRRDRSTTTLSDLRSLCRDCHAMVEALTAPWTASSLADAARRFDAAIELLPQLRRLRATVLHG